MTSSGSRNPGTADGGIELVTRNAQGAPAAPKPPQERSRPAAAPAKLSYKDQRRLAELDGLIHSLPQEIARQEAVMADPGLYARDPKAFDRAMKALDRGGERHDAADGRADQREALQAQVVDPRQEVSGEAVPGVVLLVAAAARAVPAQLQQDQRALADERREQGA